MVQNKQSNQFVNIVGIVLILMAIALTYTSKLIDFDTIAAPFEHLVEGTAIGNYIDEAKQKELEHQLNQTETPAQKLAENIKNFSGLTKAQKSYIKFQSFMEKFENSVAELPNKFVIAIAILLLFSVKSIIVLLPASATCLVTALLFPFPLAVIINIVGYCLMFTAKYFWGKHIGEGQVSRLVKHSKRLWKYIQDEENGYATGNPLLLFILRLVPTVPINPISQMYGKMGYDFWKYIILSALGISLRVVSVTSLGSNVSDPFSSAFIVPLVVILFVSGFSMIALSIILKKREGVTEGIEENKKELAK